MRQDYIKDTTEIQCNKITQRHEKYEKTGMWRWVQQWWWWYRYLLALDHEPPCEDVIYIRRKSPSSLEPHLKEIVWREESDIGRGRWRWCLTMVKGKENLGWTRWDGEERREDRWGWKGKEGRRWKGEVRSTLGGERSRERGRWLEEKER